MMRHNQPRPNSAMESDVVGRFAPLASPPRGSSPVVGRAGEGALLVPAEAGGSAALRQDYA